MLKLFNNYESGKNLGFNIFGGEGRAFPKVKP